ncbi:MAG: aminopeptidase P family protein [Chitinivibrionales bacterium]
MTSEHRARRNRKERLSRVKNILGLKKCSHILITDTVDVEYVCGFHASNAFVLISPDKNILFSDFRYREAARAFCRSHAQWRFVESRENNFSIFQEFCPVGSALGFQSTGLSVDLFDKLRRSLPKRRFVKLADSIVNALVAKEEFEIDLMLEAARIGDSAFVSTLEILRPRVTEKEVALFLEQQCRNGGSEKPSFDTIVLFGGRSALPHGEPSDERLKKGDWVLIDFGCTVDGFSSDMTRTVVAGKANGRQKEIYGIVLEAQQKARGCVKEGVSACGVDRCAREEIEKAGYAKYFGHATGHGVGRRIHESPRVSRDNKAILQRRTVITIEPGIYIPRFGGVRIEDMVVVQQGGSRLLTNAPRHLMELDI